MEFCQRNRKLTNTNNRIVTERTVDLGTGFKIFATKSHAESEYAVSPPNIAFFGKLVKILKQNKKT